MFSGFGGFSSGFSAGFNTGFGGNFVNLPQKFEDLFRCYPISMMNDRIRKDDANWGGKIFLPPSALNKLSMLNVRYPMLFEFTVPDTGKVTHGGVLEFTAEEGRTYLPNWMMETLNVRPGSLLQVGSTDVPLGQFVKIEPQSVDFLDISDPKAVLENVLRKFSTLTVDDIIEVNYNNKTYRIRVLEVKPESSSKSICVIETDLVTDFAPPVGYVEPDYKSMQTKSLKSDSDPSTKGLGSMSKRIKYAETVQRAAQSSSAFTGQGQKLTGKSVSIESPQDLKNSSINLEGEPTPLNLPDGQLFFGFPIVPPKKEDETQQEDDKPHFRSHGKTLRQKSKRKVLNDHDSPKAKAPKSPEVIELD
ncbi:LAMI_0F02322g1_1 [Lachancea mirantina]|uniref:Ubiquitin fusion degradation protein 1 n=1 Tax=Lachancea mirantina TaxID=1230905 RepID=A0A1G4JWJ5_9SACH|nr:LAMI_0F02322g1_1 [Lachancea mirantina]